MKFLPSKFNFLSVISSYNKKWPQNGKQKKCSIEHFVKSLHLLREILGSIVVSIPACHAGDRGSIPRREKLFCFLFTGGQENLSFYSLIAINIVSAQKCFVFSMLSGFLEIELGSCSSSRKVSHEWLREQ